MYFVFPVFDFCMIIDDCSDDCAPSNSKQTSGPRLRLSHPLALPAFVGVRTVCTSRKVLKIDPASGECRVLGDLGEGGWKYHGGVPWK